MKETNILFLDSNPNYSKKDLLFIEKSLKDSGHYKSLKYISEQNLRLHINSSDKQMFYVHVGSKDPYKGGSGANYEINKNSGKATLTSTEDLAPEPFED